MKQIENYQMGEFDNIMSERLEKKKIWMVFDRRTPYLAFLTIYSGISAYEYCNGNRTSLSSLLDSLITKSSIPSIV